MIVTFYFPDGRKERKAIGYKGKACDKATAPYEKREAPGTVKKTPTAEGRATPQAESQQQQKGST